MKKLFAALAIALLSVAASGQVATAGEWNKGHFNEPGGNVPAKENARSECVFNGLDEADESSLNAGDGESLENPETGNTGDDGLWGSTPAGGRVQSGGQITAAAVQATGDPGAFTGGTGVQGEACNGHTAPINN